MSLETRLSALISAIGQQLKSRSADRPGGYQSDGSRRAAFMFGCGGEGSQTGFNSGHARIPFRIPVNTKRWRVLVQNCNPDGTSTGVPASVDFTGFWIGTNFKNLDTGDPISWWGGTPVQAIPAFTLSGATAYRSAWNSVSAQQLQAGAFHMLGYAWTKTSGTIYTGSGGSWTGTAAGDVAVQAPTVTQQPWVPFHVAIEYEFEGNNRVLVAIGDSITEGAKHVWNMNAWHQVLSMRTGMPVAMSAQFGSFAGGAGATSWQSSPLTQPRWARIRDSDLNIDAAVMNLGTNETAFGGSLLQAQQGMSGTITRLKSEFGVREVYGTTIFPQNATSTRETMRVAINAWLRSGTASFFTNVFDPARFMESTVNGANMIAGLEGSGADYTHPGPAGQMRFADALAGILAD